MPFLIKEQNAVINTRISTVSQEILSKIFFSHSTEIRLKLNQLSTFFATLLYGNKVLKDCMSDCASGATIGKPVTIKGTYTGLRVISRLEIK